MSRVEVEETHESYVLVQVNRVSGLRRLFGSNVEHQHYFEFTVRPGRRIAGADGDRYYTSGLQRLIIFRMTAAQFVELITSQNLGSGVPATLSQYEGESVAEPPPVASEDTHIVNGMSQTLQDAIESMQGRVIEAEGLLKKEYLSKPARKSLLGTLKAAEQSMRTAVPFAQDMIRESAEKTLARAKVEAEAHLAAGLRSLGLETLQLKTLGHHDEDQTNTNRRDPKRPAGELESGEDPTHGSE